SHVVPLSFDRRERAAGGAPHRARQRSREGPLYALFDCRKKDAENAAAASQGRFVYGRRSRNSFRTPSHSRSGLRSPALASSMIRLAMISLARSPRAATLRAPPAISNTTPKTHSA